jgi:hypothetical protein
MKDFSLKVRMTKKFYPAAFAHKHTWTPIAPALYAADGMFADKKDVWVWCIRCGCLRLGKQLFAPGSHQHMVIIAEEKL